MRVAMADLDTLVAPASAAGVSALALIRVDGPLAHALVTAALHRSAPPAMRHASVGLWRGMDGAAIDQVVVTCHAAGASHTGNAAAEISCHGNPLIVRRIVEDCLARGARMAEPGEFTRRAFLNGRMDLAQAEAVADLIHASSERALEAARRQLAGELGRAIAGWTDEALGALATLEAHIDFPEEDLPPENPTGPRQRLIALAKALQAAAATERHDAALRSGIRLAVVGAPNAGKSSLLNALAGENRALVSTEPGTTRDYLEARVTGLPLAVTAVDTAGLRSGGGELERAGMERSLAQAESADFLLAVVDRSQPPPELPARLLARLVPGQAAVVENKSDLPPHPALARWLPELPRLTTCLTSAEGAQAARAAVAQTLEQADLAPTGDALIVSSRHADALRRAADSLNRAADHLRQGSRETELAATEVRGAIDALGEVIGRVDNERMLDKLFASFCIGK
jgi:tRNA modification GTPase